MDVATCHVRCLRNGRARTTTPLNLVFDRQTMSKVRKTTRFKNIGALVKGKGDITTGRIGPVRCAAVAGDGDQQLAMLVR